MRISAKLRNAILSHIQKFEDVATDAVQHVGLANYAEREREAIDWVEKASEQLLNDILAEIRAR